MSTNKPLDFVNVSLRIKPTLKDTSSSLEVINYDPPVLVVADKSQFYHFDNIFTADVAQKQVYAETVKPLVDHVKSGYNCTVFAYGQTGTGKTYTMGTNPDIRGEDDAGLISRALEDFFCLTPNDEEIEVYISFIEIYNEKVFDLLTTNKVPLSIKGFTVHGFEKIKIYETHNALSLLTSGGKNRHTGGTKQNFNSSRSHAIFTIHYHWRNSQAEIAAKLNLVDLAGSESIRKTGNRGSSLNEGININKGLLSLGQVMTALSNNSIHIPYRQSVLTTILQDSLNKKNYVSLIACISPNTEDLGETLQTLEFSQRVKRIKNRPEVNHIVTQYRRDVRTPLKRSNDLMYETPFKTPRFPLPVITEPTTNHSYFDNSKSVYSASTCENNGQQNFSPVIKRYLTAMEESLMTKLEDVINNTLKKSTRRKSFNRENLTPTNLPWDEVKTKVRFTSSPMGEEEASLLNNSVRARLSPKKLLADEASFSSIEDVDSSKLQEVVFKVPAPAQKRKKKPQIGPSPVKRRSSMRLQLKQQHCQDDGAQRRRSVRLQTKAEDDQKSQRSMKNQSTKNHSTNRVNRKLPKEQVRDGASPFTKRTRQVLNILNSGSLKDIATLHTVGAKTAEKILLFRQLIGDFGSISDLCKMPYWTQNKYEKFLAVNFLKDDR